MNGEHKATKALTDEIQHLHRRIADLKTSVSALRQVENELDLIFNLVPDMLVVASTDGYFKKLNPAWETTLGFSIEELLSKPFMSFVHPDDVASTMKEIERQISGEPTIRFENRYLCKTGEYKWLEWVATPAVDKTLLYAAARDITGRKKAEEALQESEAKFHELFETSHDVIVFLDRDGNIIDINRRGEELTHYPKSELLHMNEFQHLMVPEDHAKIRRVVAEAFGGRESRYEERWRTKEGEIIYFDGLTVPRRSARGEVVSTFCTLRDITEHKRADDALKESEEKFRVIVESAFDGILIADVESRKFIFGNKAICRMLGYPPEEIRKLSVYDIHPENDLPYVISQFEMQARGTLGIASDIPLKRRTQEGEKRSKRELKNSRIFII